MSKELELIEKLMDKAEANLVSKIDGVSRDVRGAFAEIKAIDLKLDAHVVDTRAHGAKATGEQESSWVFRLGALVQVATLLFIVYEKVHK